MPFNPFGVPLRDIGGSDLQTLRNVEEGWYVEYKREFPSARVVAKSLAAFANHHGGWVFFGVAEATTGPPIAESFPGLDGKDIRTVLNQLTAAASAHIDPTPYFEYRIVDGPCGEIELPPGRAVLIIHVPRGAHAPYIHSSGKIYRRKADSSDPVAETERAVLDGLLERSRRRNQRLSAFLDDLPAVSEAENHLCHVHLFLMTDPWHESGHTCPETFEDFARALNGRDPRYGGLPFDNCYSSADGYIARQSRNNDPRFQVLTWVHHLDNAVRVSVPLNTRRLRNEFLPFVNGRYQYAEQFAAELGRIGHDDPQVVDLNVLASFFMASLTKYQAMNADRGIQENGFAKVVIQHAWRRVPYWDVASYIRHVEAYGAPVVQSDTLVIPSDIHGTSLMPIESRELADSQEPRFRQLHSSIGLLVACCEALGIPRSVAAAAESEPFEAAERAMIGAPPWE